MKTYHDIASDGGSDIVAQVRAQEAQLESRLDRIGHVVAIMSGKGGVGKSSLTVNLATALLRLGLKVGIVDADINGASVVQMAGVARHPGRSEQGVSPAVTADGVQIMSIDLFLQEGEPVEWAAQTQKSAFTWRAMVEVAAIREMLADTAWQPLDILLVDLPPGTDRLPNLLDIVPKLSAAVVVTVPSRASTYVVRKSITLAQKQFGQMPIGLIENMSEFLCDECGKAHRLFPNRDENDLIKEKGVSLLGNVPFDPLLGEETDRGNPYVSLYPDRPAAKAIYRVSQALCELIGLQVSAESTLENVL